MSKADVNQPNGYAQWAIVGLAVMCLAFNTGVTYRHIHELSVSVGKLAENVGDMNKEINGLKIEVSRIQGIIYPRRNNLVENNEPVENVKKGILVPRQKKALTRSNI